MENNDTEWGSGVGDDQAAQTARRLNPLAYESAPTPRAKYLRPRPGVWTLHRDRLFVLLDRTLDVPLTTVVAPAGYGKTTLVVDWLASRSHASAWFSLDGQDADPRIFLAGMLEVLRPFNPLGVAESLSMLARGAHPEAGRLASLVERALAPVDQDVVLVIEDYHVIDHPATNDVLTALSRFPRSRLHLLITSRSSLPLPISLLRARGHLHEITMDDLRFTVSEVGDFLRTVGIPALDPHLERELADLSEGWIAYLHLIALAGTRTGTIREPGRRGASIAALAFLAEDVLHTLDPALQDLLLHLAIPSKISPSLAMALYPQLGSEPEAQRRLDQIRLDGLFLSRLDSEYGWYRFHPLFRDLLLTALARTKGASERTEMHQRAIRWFSEHGLVRHSIDHLLAIDSTAEATQVVIDHVQEALVEERWADLQQWLAALPPTAQESSVELLLGRAWIAQVQGAYDLIPVCIDRIQQVLARYPTSTLSEPALDAEIGLLRLFVPDRAMTREAGSRIVELALDRLSGSDRYAELIAVQMVSVVTAPLDPGRASDLVECFIAESQLRGDRFATHRLLWGRAAQVGLSRQAGSVYQYLEAAALLRRLATKHGSQRLQGQGETFTGNALYELDRLEDALEYYHAALRIPTLGILFYLMATMMLARTYDALGRHDEAGEVLERVHERFLDGGLTTLIPTIRHFMQSRESRVGGRSARILASSLASSFAVLPAREIEPRYLSEFWTALEERDNDWMTQAIAQLDLHREDAARLHSRGYVLTVDTLHALVLYRAGRPQQAERRLDQVIADAEQGGYVRAIADLGPQVRTMLDWYASLGKQHGHLDRILQAFRHDSIFQTNAVDPLGAKPGRASNRAGESLSIREYDVLLGLQRRLSNKEIAEELSISHVTVKSHTRWIYAKLGVNSRRQAVTRAVFLGIIPAER